MKRIIVPIDFSEQSELALEVAAKLAHKNNSELFVLHMLELSPAIMSGSDYIPQVQIVHLLKVSEKRLKEFVDKPYLKDLNITPIIKHYKVFGEINEIAKEHEIDLIVMGSHGVDGLEEIFIGSNTDRVVRTSDVPVFVVKHKDNVKYFKSDTFVFACDFNEDNMPAVKKALDFAKKIGAELRMVYINTPGDNFLSQQDAYKKISHFLNEMNLGLEVDIYNDYTVEKGILNYSENVAADMIGIPTHGRKGLSHFFMGSIGEDVANHSQIPVVTFKI